MRSLAGSSLAMVAIVVTACGSPSPSGSPADTASAVASAVPSVPAASPASSPGTSPAAIDAPLASKGTIAVLGQDGSLQIFDNRGHETMLADASGGTFGLPTWSPDGAHLAI